MTEWEYKVVDMASWLGVAPSVEDYIECVQPRLNQEGKDGWELVAVHGFMAFFKRERS